MNPFWFESGGFVNPWARYSRTPNGETYKFPIKVGTGDIIELSGERHLAIAKTKATPIELSHCRACSLFRKPICGLLECEKIRFERVM